MKKIVEQAVLPQVAHEQVGIELQEQEQIGRWKAYAGYKDSEIEWLGEIPAHWDIRRIKETMTIINGHPFASEHFNFTEGKPLIRIRDLVNSSTETFYAGTPVKEATVFNNDILIGMDGDFNICWWQGGEALLNQRLCCIREKNLVDKRFVYYLLRFPLKLINDLTWFTTVKHLSSAQISSISFGYPPFSEQQTIVAFLDRETTRIDDLIAKKEQHIALLQEQRAAIINQAVTKGLNTDAPMKESGIEWLGKIPEGWRAVKIKRLCIVKRGSSPRPIDDQGYFDENGEYAWVRISDVTASSRYLQETEQRLSALGASKSVNLQPGELFLSIAGSVGKAIITQIKCCIHDGFVYFVGLKENREYLYYILSCGEIYKGLGKLGTQLNLNTDTIGDIYVPIPPRDEQQSIVTYLEQETTKLDKLITAIQESIKKLKEYSTALISAAISGKIDVRGEVAAGSVKNATT